MSAGAIRLAVVTAYPPSQASLNEYGYHLVKSLASTPEVAELLLLRDEVDGELEDLPANVTDRPTWRFGSWRTPLRVLRAVRATRPDVVLLNLHFSSFGTTKVAAALGLMTVPLLRLFGIRTQVLLHNVVEAVDLSSAGFARSRLAQGLLRRIGRIMTRAVLTADVVAVTIGRYVELLREHYGATHVVLTPHGAFDDLGPWIVNAPRSDEGPFRVLAFGKFGTYKRIDDLVTAMRMLRAEGRDDLELVVAGTDSPNNVGYLDRMAAQCSDLPGVRFTGYVAEHDVPALFEAAGAVVFPYTSTTGSSGVLHQAGSYAAAVVLPELGDFVDLIRDEGFDGVTFDPACPQSLARAIARLHDDEELRHDLGLRNYAAARGVTMSDVADWHLMHLMRLAA